MTDSTNSGLLDSESNIIRAIFGVFIPLVLLIIFINLGMLLIGIIRMFFIDFHWMNITYLILILMVGVVFSIINGINAMNYAKLKVLRSIFNITKPSFKKLCRSMVEKTKKAYEDQENEITINRQMKSVFDNAEYLSQLYQATPGIIRGIIKLFIGEIPLINIIPSFKKEIQENDIDTATEKVYQASCKDIEENVLATDTSWLKWLIPVNILLQLFILFVCM